MAELQIHPVTTDQLTSLRRLFDGARTTRHCWCMAFCSTPWQFASGWYGGGNRRRFEAMAGSESHPMGRLASRGDEPIGWVACGPRARYLAAIAGRSSLLRDRDRDEDVWLIPCLYVAPGDPPGVLAALVAAAVELAQDAGATAIEAWPTAAGVRQPALAHLGSEALFARHGFRRVTGPTELR